MINAIFAILFTILNYANIATAQSAILDQPQYQLNNKQVPLGTVLVELEASGQLNAFIDKSYALLSEVPEFRFNKDVFKEQLRQLTEKAKTNPYLQWPVTNTERIQRAFAFIAQQKYEPAAPKALTPLQKLADIVTKQTVCKYKSEPLKEIMPGLTTGHITNDKVSDCYLVKSEALAELMTRLSEGEAAQSPILVYKKPIHSASTLLIAMLQENIRIQLNLDKTTADFAALNFNGYSVILPFWLNVGFLPTRSTSPQDRLPLVIPMSHSQFTFVFSGAKLNTSIRFFMGVDGMKFYSNTTQRPQWSGWSVTNMADSTQGINENSKIIIASSLAEGLIARNRLEARNMRNNGYGYSGVCNDSTALIEIALRQKMPEESHGLLWTVYPTLRSPELTSKPMPYIADLNEENLSDVYNLLYLTPSEQSDRNRLKRISLMTTDTSESVYELIPDLRDTMRKVNEAIRTGL